MIDLIVPSRCIVYRFIPVQEIKSTNTTKAHSAVEYFCIAILGYQRNVLSKKRAAIFILPQITNTHKKWSKFPVIIVKITLTKKDYKYEMGSHLVISKEEELSTEQIRKTLKKEISSWKTKSSTPKTISAKPNTP
jgi:hypothetical protein